MSRWGMLLIVLWAGGLAGCPSAGQRPPQPGTTQEAPGEIHTLRQQAVQGDGEAQYRLGIMLHTGEGVPQNETDAVQWLQRAATQGHPAAQRLLGRLGGVSIQLVDLTILHEFQGIHETHQLN